MGHRSVDRPGKPPCIPGAAIGSSSAAEREFIESGLRRVELDEVKAAAAQVGVDPAHVERAARLVTATATDPPSASPRSRDPPAPRRGGWHLLGGAWRSPSASSPARGGACVRLCTARVAGRLAGAGGLRRVRGDGVYQGTVSVPPQRRLLSVHGDRAFGVFHDELGVEYVVVVGVTP